jgi:metallophosphoesterase (TIGR03768 family)
MKMKIDNQIKKDVKVHFDVLSSKNGEKKILVLNMVIDQFSFTASTFIDAMKLSQENIIDKRSFEGTLNINGMTYLFKTSSVVMKEGVIEFLDSNKISVGKLKLPEGISGLHHEVWYKDNISWLGNSYPIDNKKAVTTAYEVIKPRQARNTDFDIKLYDKSTWDNEINNLGFDVVKPGLTHEVRWDIVDKSVSYPFQHEKKLLNFFTISDIHITDKESPNQLIYLQQLKNDAIHYQATPVYSPVMPYTTHVLDAVVQTVNALHENEIIKFDLGISLGDTCNTTQQNETRWYIDVLNGGLIEPSSGNHDGEHSVDYQMPFVASGLNKKIPWYQVIGNHDLFWMGSVPVDGGQRKNLRESYLSDTVIRTGDVFGCYPNNIVGQLNLEKYSMGVIDGNTIEGKIACQGEALVKPKIAADSNRRSLKAVEWMNEFYGSNGISHGLPHIDSLETTRETFACYSFHPVPYIKIICLDDLQREDDGDPGIHGHGFLDANRWKWLKKELEEGELKNELMIIAAHAPIGVIAPEGAGILSPFGWADFLVKESGVPTEHELIDKLHNTPNLLMWIAGHRHFNTISVFEATHGDNTNSFWQVETSSLRDFPQQLRTFEISLADDLVSVKTTNVDYEASHPTYPASKSREYAVIAQQIANNQDIFQPAEKTLPYRHIRPMPESGSYNAILLKKINRELADKLNVK